MKKPFATTLEPGSSLSNLTGAWRTLKPTYVSLLPPCNAECPAGENIQGWLFHVGAGEYEEAWRVLVKDNPMPAIMGRVCYHTCQNACNRQHLDGEVGINSVEQFLGDEAIKQEWSFEKADKASGKRVLVVGSGPGGLSAAYHLAKLGHEVEIYEADSMVGGMLRFGIPQYRLPREVLDKEIQRILDLDITLKLNTKVTDVSKSMKEGNFDAVFLAVGAHIGKSVSIPSDNKSPKIMDAISVLRSMESDKKPSLGENVIVYGGGNTAIDVARTAIRLGAKETTIVYRRNREKMPAHDFEVEEALEEGIKIKFLSTIKECGNNEITVEKMELDESGFPQSVGEFEKLKADSVVLALGQDSDLSLLENESDFKIEKGVLQIDDNMMTNHSGVFAGGDMVPSDRTVTIAIGHGKKAARNIDAWLRGEEYKAPPKKEIVDFEKLNTWYYSEAAATQREKCDITKRQSTFDEVQSGLNEDDAIFEAHRCFSCGNCFNCDNCYGVCPDNSVNKLESCADETGYEFNYDYCKGCGICAKECPCGAIKMEPENI